MTALLKALGVTVWGLTAIGLAVVGMIVAVHALRSGPTLAPRNEIDSPRGTPENSFDARAPTMAFDAPGEQGPPKSKVAAVPPASSGSGDDPATTRGKLQAAAASRSYNQVIGYGQQLASSGYALPEDLEQIAVAYYNVRDCARALQYLDRSGLPVSAEAPQRQRIVALCRGGGAPALPSRPPSAPYAGERDVKTGEVYFGFGDYERAVLLLERAIAEGDLRHADEAFVYLGRAYFALGDYPRACQAFDAVAGVPGVSPRVARLWGLYADTHCRAPPRGN